MLWKKKVSTYGLKIHRHGHGTPGSEMKEDGSAVIIEKDTYKWR